jgi:hypothetical protein
MSRENLNRRHYLDETSNCAVQEALSHFWTLPPWVTGGVIFRIIGG